MEKEQKEKKRKKSKSDGLPQAWSWASNATTPMTEKQKTPKTQKVEEHQKQAITQ